MAVLLRVGSVGVGSVGAAHDIDDELTPVDDGHLDAELRAVRRQVVDGLLDAGLCVAVPHAVSDGAPGEKSSVPIR
ncbi:hypothetical protein ACFT2C_21415 [Promicromonospora sp. NPDC057138]|uniref:hypothetical protein n=1 Tax=Promicromonospora sp. NPDC057138 TaxID=3346031 RepID=UPI0036297887